MQKGPYPSYPLPQQFASLWPFFKYPQEKVAFSLRAKVELGFYYDISFCKSNAKLKIRKR